jgi:hypothetical protein
LMETVFADKAFEMCIHYLETANDPLI